MRIGKKTYPRYTNFVLDILLDFMFPRMCVGCGRYGVDLCSDCFCDLSISEQICPECGEESEMGWTHQRCKRRWGMDGLIVVYDHQDTIVKAAVDGVKFDFNKKLIGDLLENFRFKSGEKFDCLLAVPLHFYRKNWRGFNQAKEVALVVGEKMGVYVLDCLVRTKRTKQQATLTSRLEREKNIKGVFEVNSDSRKRLKNSRVLLIDDVFTSGADMRECTKVLKKSGVEIVWGFALAH